MFALQQGFYKVDSYNHPTQILQKPQLVSKMMAIMGLVTIFLSNMHIGTL